MNPGITLIANLKRILNEYLNEKQEGGGGRREIFLNYEKPFIPIHHFSVFRPAVVASMEPG